MLSQVHSAWMANIPLFKGARDLPSSFFVELLGMLEAVVFAPMEAVIESHHLADRFFVVTSGIVMAERMKITCAGNSFGDDSLSAYRRVRVILIVSVQATGPVSKIRNWG